MQPDPTISVSVDQRIAQLRVQFEKSLRTGDSPRIEQLLPEVDESARPQLLRVLLGAELKWRHRAGQSPVVGEYLERFPEHPELVLEVLGQAAVEIDAKTLASSDQAVETEDAAAEPVNAPARPAVSATLSHRPEAEEQSQEPRAEETGKRKVTLDDFVSSLTECGLMDQVEVDAFIEELPADERPINGKQLAELLYRHKRLTRFQVQAVYQRKTRTSPEPPRSRRERFPPSESRVASSACRHRTDGTQSPIWLPAPKDRLRLSTGPAKASTR